MGCIMFKLLSSFGCALILLATVATFFKKDNALSLTQDDEQKVVSQAHDFVLDGIDGKQHSLAEYIGHGKWVVVNVWATACPFCRDELFDLADFHDRHHEKDAIVLGLTLDLATFGFPDKKYLTSFAESYLIDYPILMVSGDIASKVVGKPINRVPVTLFYNPDGKLVYSVNGMVSEKMLEDVIANKKPLHHSEWGDKATHVNNPNLE